MLFPSENVLTLKKKIFLAYFSIAFLFSIYGWLFGAFKYRGFFYNLGKGIVWPVTIFPALGEIIGAIIIVAVVVAVLIFGNKSNRWKYQKLITPIFSIFPSIKLKINHTNKSRYTLFLLMKYKMSRSIKTENYFPKR